MPVDYEHLDPVMEVQGLTGYGFKDISFKLYPGEILGIAGVVGAGRTELISTISAGTRRWPARCCWREKILPGCPPASC